MICNGPHHVDEPSDKFAACEECKVTYCGDCAMAHPCGMPPATLIKTAVGQDEIKTLSVAKRALINLLSTWGNLGIAMAYAAQHGFKYKIAIGDSPGVCTMLFHNIDSLDERRWFSVRLMPCPINHCTVNLEIAHLADA
jgi:hypothetical protein